MEAINSIVVCFIIIMFGALISLGNERQRKALDSLRDQILHWSIQDLKLKRERLAREIKVDDPLHWFGGLISKVTGRSLQVQFSGSFDEPGALVFDSMDFSGKYIFSPICPADIRRMSRKAKGRLAYIDRQNPLLTLPRGVFHHELSALNCGAFFDLELQDAWKTLTGKDIEEIERLWVYELPR